MFLECFKKEKNIAFLVNRHKKTKNFFLFIC